MTDYLKGIDEEKLVLTKIFARESTLWSVRLKEGKTHEVYAPVNVTDDGCNEYLVVSDAKKKSLRAFFPMEDIAAAEPMATVPVALGVAAK